MKRFPLILVTLLCGAGALLAACGSSTKTDSTPATTPPASTTPASTTPAKSAGLAIDMQNTAFSPQDATAKVGEKITWTNSDGFDHNVTARSGATFKSSDFGQGGTFSFTPTKPGKINYVCTIHLPGMVGTITVTK